jgi:hypothetical protein
MTATTRRRLRNVVAVLLVGWLLVVFPGFVIPFLANMFLGVGVELPLPAGLFREDPEFVMALLTFGPVVILGLLALALVRLSREPGASAPPRNT